MIDLKKKKDKLINEIIFIVFKNMGSGVRLDGTKYRFCHLMSV